MKHSIQDSWDKFERWERNYKRVCTKYIEEMFKCGYSEFDGGLFLSQWVELNQDIILDLGVSESELSTRLTDKINFIRGYLVDISFDGGDFMAEKSTFLTQQYPSKCNNSFGVWLEQYMEGDIEAGGYFGFQEWDVNFFCKDIEDVDLASMRGVLPFDRMFVRRPKGIKWDDKSSKDILQKVKYDLECDYQVVIKPDDGEYDELYCMEFDWD